MTDDGNTEELRPIPATIPRPAGRRSYTAGLVIGATIYPISLGAAFISDGTSFFDSRPAQLFAILGILSLMVYGAALIIAGGNARQLQKQLEPFHVGLVARERESRHNRLLLERLTLENRERYENIIGLVAPLPGRLDALEKHIEKVPAVTDAFLAGMQLRSKVEDDELS